ncbi:MAG: SagB/ThcOx family dehydrogenase [Acidobacteriia bacterium]|nr:SagB/ThcOx family dehydrogenase [Terriglobia bacterium]
MTVSFMKKAFVLVLLASAAWAETAATIPLPKPHTTGGMPLMQALNARKSGREFSPEKLSPQALSNLLWAAYGVNRPDGRRTAPSASNRQTIDVYVALAEGVYLYNAKEHRLDLVVPGDLRAAAGLQPFVAQAPLNLVYVADYAKMAELPDATRVLYSAAETGSIGQNVYLYCASEGFSTVIRAMVNRDALAKALHLRPEQKITLSQTVGYPSRTPAEKKGAN